jgi:hypothetical protein
MSLPSDGSHLNPHQLQMTPGIQFQHETVKAHELSLSDITGGSTRDMEKTEQ